MLNTLPFLVQRTKTLILILIFLLLCVDLILLSARYHLWPFKNGMTFKNVLILTFSDKKYMFNFFKPKQPASPKTVDEIVS